MGFFDSWFGKKPQGHSATITQAAATAVQRIAAQQRLRLEKTILLIERSEAGEPLLGFSQDASLSKSPNHAVAKSRGITVAMPCSLVSLFADLVIDFEHGGFRFCGTSSPRTEASNPGDITLSHERLFRLSPQLRTDEDGVQLTAHYLSQGDSRAAIVLIVAAYTDELCAVALLKFPEWLAAENRLTTGTRLLTVNTYVRGNDIVGDLVRGEGATTHYRNFTPHIADFLASNPDRVKERKSEIAEAEWNITSALAADAMKRARGRYRDGCPPNSETPAY
jgi:hypothetical protein